MEMGWNGSTSQKLLKIMKGNGVRRIVNVCT